MRKIKFIAHYQKDDGTWQLLTPETMDVMANKPMNFSTQILGTDGNTYTEKISLELKANVIE